MRLATSNNLLLVLQDAPKHILYSPGRGEGGRGYGGAERVRKRLYTYRYTVTTRMTPAFYYNWFSIGQLGKHHVHLTGLVSVIFSMSFVFVSNYLLLYFWVEILSDFYFFCTTFCHWLLYKVLLDQCQHYAHVHITRNKQSLWYNSRFECLDKVSK